MRDLLKAWGPLEVVGVLGGGNRNTVLEARLDTRRVVVRRSRRPPASLTWEADLLDHLARNGLRVPEALPALDGRRHIDGVMVQTWLDGTPPETADWPAVIAFLRRLHQITALGRSAHTPLRLVTCSPKTGVATWTCPQCRLMRLPIAAEPGHAWTADRKPLSTATPDPPTSA